MQCSDCRQLHCTALHCTALHCTVPYHAVPGIARYGSSILQGGVASRPGQVNTHVVSRALSREVFNFGFSGNCLMEISVAQYLAQLDVGMFIIDCNPNMNASVVTFLAGFEGAFGSWDTEISRYCGTILWVLEFAEIENSGLENV